MTAPDYAKQPWKHPACWTGHIISMTRETSNGAIWSVATCECGWTFRGEMELMGAERRDVEMHDHWLDVIAKAEATPA